MMSNTTQPSLWDQLAALLGGGGSNGAQSYGAGPDTAQGLNIGGQSPTTIVLPESSTGIGMNIGTGQMALSGLASLGSLYGSLQSNKLAKEQFKFTKDFANTNLNNQIKSYNTTLSDKIHSRSVMDGTGPAAAEAYLDKNRLTR